MVPLRVPMANAQFALLDIAFSLSGAIFVSAAVAYGLETATGRPRRPDTDIPRRERYVTAGQLTCAGVAVCVNMQTATNVINKDKRNISFCTAASTARYRVPQHVTICHSTLPCATARYCVPQHVTACRDTLRHTGYAAVP